MNPENETIASILSAAETIAVVGLSDGPARASHRIAAYLQEAGYRVIPINPRIESALGEKAYPSLGEVKERVDIVNAFRRSQEIPSLVDETIQQRPRAFWMQKRHRPSRLRAPSGGCGHHDDSGPLLQDRSPGTRPDPSMRMSRCNFLKNSIATFSSVQAR